jgi:hypothetical protein
VRNVTTLALTVEQLDNMLGGTGGVVTGHDVTRNASQIMRRSER